MLELADYLILTTIIVLSNFFTLGLSFLYAKGKLIYMLNDILPKMAKNITKAVFRQFRSEKGNAAKQDKGSGGFDLGQMLGPIIQEVGPSLIKGFIDKQITNKPPGV
jgi:hypothetical protein